MPRRSSALPPLSEPALGAVPARSLWDWAAHFQAQQARGEELGDIARRAGKTRRYVQKALWLGSWPADLRERVQANPAKFPARVLLNHFASQMKAFDARALDGWRTLRREIARFESRAGTPVRRYGARAAPARPAEAPVPLPPATVHRVEALLRGHLQTWVRVDDNEIRIRHHGAVDVERLLEVLGIPF